MAPPDDPAITDVRDPFVFGNEGRRYAIQGAGRAGGEPVILLYGADRLDRWTELGALLDYADPLVREVARSEIWECPNLALIDGRWVLIVSLWDSAVSGPRADGVSYLIGDLVPAGDGLRFVPESGGQLDVDGSFYAPQVLALPDRTLLWGWAREVDRSQEQLDAAGWAGVLTFPRELTVVDGVLFSRPARELTGLRREPITVDGVITATAFEVSGRFRGALRLILRDDRDHVVADLTADDPTAISIMVDASMIEIFGEGRQPLTLRAYPGEDSGWIVETDDAELTGWRLG